MNTRRTFQTLGIGLLFALICGQHALAQGMNTNDPNIPPIPSTYIWPTTTYGPGPVVFSQMQFKPSILSFRNPSGPNEVASFDAAWDGLVSISGNSNVPANSSGPVVTIAIGKAGNTTGTFPTEMLSMNLTGTSPLPFMIRESPTLASLGQTSVTNIGGGLYHIDSFFDVFTELSLDAGATWIPSNSSSHIVLVPEPGSLILIGLGIFGLSGVTRRRK